MNANEKLLALVNRFPGPTNHSIKDAAENETVNKLVEELLASGPEAITGLVDYFAEPGADAPENAKARFLLHAAVVRAGVTGRETERKQVASALAGTLAGERPKEILASVVRELQWIAGPESAAALGKLLTDETLCEDAARALVNIGGEPAVAEFRAALAKAQGKPKLTIVQNLGVLRDTKSAEALKSLAADVDSQLRVAAVWGLANMGEPTAVEVAIKAASGEGYERIQHTKSCLLLAERLAKTGRKNEARRLYSHLIANRMDPEEMYVREAAERGLAATEAASETDGFRLLFNGKDLAGWQSAAGKPPGAGWVIEEGALVRKTGSGDIWTAERFGDFVLDVEFKAEGNSGIFIRTDKPTDNVQTGIEIQVDRPSKNPGKHSVGAIYDLVAPSKNAATSEWNRAVITAQGAKLTVALNGEKVAEMDLDQWSTAGQNPDGSKNKFRTALKDFKREGHIGLQDHGAVVMYRNMKIKPLGL